MKIFQKYLKLCKGGVGVTMNLDVEPYRTDTVIDKVIGDSKNF
jgi:hypothetical protein